MWWWQNCTFQFYPRFLVKCSEFYCPCENFLVLGKKTALFVKQGGKKPAWEPALVDHREPTCCQPSLTTPHAVHAHQSCISELGSGDVAGGIQCPWFLIYTSSLPLRYLINRHRPGSLEGGVEPAVSQQNTDLGARKPIPLPHVGAAVIFRSCTELRCL